MLKSPTKILYQSGTLYPDDIQSMVQGHNIKFMNDNRITIGVSAHLFLPVRIPLYQKIKILFKRKVAVLVTEIIHCALLGFVGMRDVAEVKSLFVKFVFMH